MVYASFNTQYASMTQPHTVRLLPFETMRLQGNLSGHTHIVEDTEAHAVALLGMMTGWAGGQTQRLVHR